MEKKKEEPSGMQEVHCSTCGRFLGYQCVIIGIVSIFCPRCKNFTQICNYPEENNMT